MSSDRRFVYISNMNNNKRKSSRIIIIAALAAASVIIVLSVILMIVSHNRNRIMTDPGDAIIPNISVTFTKLSRSGFHKDRELIYYSDGEKSSRAGVDVSYAQKEIDWNKVKAYGIDFAMVRAGYRGYESGALNIDEYFHRNMTEAQKAGVETGVYFFSQALNETEAIEEANYVISLIEKYNITYPVAFDWEPVTSGEARTDNIAGDTLTRCALAFCRTVEQHGYKPVIYASLNLLRDKYDKYSIDEISEYDLWLAEYKDFPEYPYQFRMWQYSSEAVIDGIDYPTDVNIFCE